MMDKIQASKFATEILTAALNNNKIVTKSPNASQTYESANEYNIELICKAFREIYNTIQESD